MPAGRYRIVANRDGVLSSREPFPATYYPGVLDKALAGVLTVRAGEAQENLEFRIRATAKVVSVSGRFEFKDGRPVSYEGLRFTPLTGGQEEHFPVAEDGSFRISLLAGRPGNLVGELFVQRDAIKACPQFGTGTIKGRISGPATPPALIATEQDQSNVILTLEMESCAGWKPRH
jgi:hypothetical protein